MPSEIDTKLRESDANEREDKLDTDDATTAALQSTEVRERLPKIGAEPMAMTPGEFDALVREELRSNAVLVKAAGIKPN